MKYCRSLAAAALLIAVATPAAAQSVQLEFHDGLVNLSAQDASVSAILAEWTRLGGTQIVNGDRVPGAPLTLELTGIPERQALDILLRSASGYMVGPRQANGGGSSFDRIMILPTSNAPVNQPPPPMFTPSFPQPDPDFPPEFGDPFDAPPEDPDAEFPGVRRFRTPRDFVPPEGVDGQPMPPQPFQPEPEDDPTLDAPARPPVSQPGFPFGVPGAARPGVIVPAPQPNQNGRAPQIGDDR